MARNYVKFGVIGAGGIARRRTIPGMLRAKNCRLVAVMDTVDPDGVAAEFNVSRAYRREADLLADPEVEAVYIASPAYCHARQIKLAAEAGKHILCEKPLTLRLDQARKAVALCRRRRVFLQEGYMMKFHGAHVRIKQLIDEGRLGQIVYLRAQLSCWYPPIDGAWRQDLRKGGGGALIDMASHLYDLIEYFAGPIRRIVAMTGNLVQDYSSEDASTTLVKLESGAQATVDCFFCIPDEASRTRSGDLRLSGDRARRRNHRPERGRQSGSHARPRRRGLRRRPVKRRGAEVPAAAVPGHQSLHGRVQLLCRLHPPRRAARDQRRRRGVAEHGA